MKGALYEVEGEAVRRICRNRVYRFRTWNPRRRRKRVALRGAKEPVCAARERALGIQLQREVTRVRLSPSGHLQNRARPGARIEKRTGKKLGACLEDRIGAPGGSGVEVVSVANVGGHLRLISIPLIKTSPPQSPPESTRPLFLHH